MSMIKDIRHQSKHHAEYKIRRSSANYSVSGMGPNISWSAVARTVYMEGRFTELRVSWSWSCIDHPVWMLETARR